MRSLSEQEHLELIANDFLSKGTANHRHKNLEQARKCYSISFALNRYLEKEQFMRLCKDLLESTGVDEDYLIELQRGGCGVVSYCMNLLDIIRKKLDE